MQQFKYLVDKGGRKAGCGTDSALIAILLFLPLVGLLGLIAPLMLFIFPLLLGEFSNWIIPSIKLRARSVSILRSQLHFLCTPTA